MVDFTELTPIDRALIAGLERLGGVASERDLAPAAAETGENGPHGAGAHFAKNLRALKPKGILETVTVGRPLYVFTDEAWARLGHSGPAPRPEQEGLF